jgi:hypothetical protein
MANYNETNQEELKCDCFEAILPHLVKLETNVVRSAAHFSGAICCPNLSLSFEISFALINLNALPGIARSRRRRAKSFVYYRWTHECHWESERAFAVRSRSRFAIAAQPKMRPSKEGFHLPDR